LLQSSLISDLFFNIFQYEWSESSEIFEYNFSGHTIWVHSVEERGSKKPP
jgi:hypothetical protein